MKQVSIIMPVLNRELFLPLTLSSIEKQTYTNWHLIVVDDGSEDQSLKIAEGFKSRNPGKCSILHSNHNASGAAACRNLGVKSATGVFIIFLDSDDLLAPYCLEQRVSVMQKDASLDWAVFGQYKWLEGETDAPKLFNKPVTTKEEAIKFFIQMDPPWQTMASIWKKETFLKLNGFDDKLFYMEDPDLHLRALLDRNLKTTIKIDLPPDCYYRVSNMDVEKVDFFYHNSIVNRFFFLRKVLTYLDTINSVGEQERYKRYIKRGFLSFTKNFLLSRLANYESDFIITIDILNNENVLSIWDKYFLYFVKNIFTSQSSVVSTLRIKGLLFKII